MSTHLINTTKAESTDTVSDEGPDPSSDLYTFLATANVEAKTSDCNYVVLRALLDGGSQLSLITEHARNLLGIKTVPTKTQIELKGINNSSF